MSGTQSAQDPRAEYQQPQRDENDLKDRSDDAGDDVTHYRDRPSDDGKKGQKANRSDAPAAKSSLGNFSEEDLPGDDPAQDQ